MRFGEDLTIRAARTWLPFTRRSAAEAVAAGEATEADAAACGAVEVPVSDDGHVIARWEFRGAWTGHRPAGARAEPGVEVVLRGADILRLDESGRIAEYWLSDDLLDVYAAIGAELPWTG